MLSTLAGRVPKVSRTTSSPSRTTMWSAIDPVGISRTPATLSCAGSSATSCLPLTMSGSTRAEPAEQPRGADVVDPRHRRQRPTDLLGHQRQVDQRRPVTADRLRQRHRRCAHGAQPFPQALVEAGLLGGADGLDRAVRLEELLVRRLQRLVVLGQAVVQPAQFVAVHPQRSFLVLAAEEEVVRVVVEIVVEHLGRQVQRHRLGDDAALSQHRPVRREDHLVRARGCACSAAGCPAAASATTPTS